eukprot:CAMPEP_0180577670 /NCGR_PEP_ID=MMETSP1037_2-20121125/12059_1 /TAXON_ID=632150 /ORGANISM="Azadinium spinosum, Strain 3D9" /LENGTH=60 /DNA_ID=CAMNT_0022595435 /DNA_START=85 /DNA_END=264 /DNA_ORIENTATION=-
MTFGQAKLNTGQALAVHRFEQHRIERPMRVYVRQICCAACLLEFHPCERLTVFGEELCLS